MGVCVIADPGANWRAVPGEELWQGKARFKRLIKMTAAAGADVFKPQFLRRTVYPEGSTEAELVSGYEWPVEWLPFLRDECELRGLEFMCTVYEPEHVAVLDPYVKRWKVASFEAQRPDLLYAMAATQKPVIVSTGAGYWDSVLAGAVVEFAWKDITFLHCVSAYPAKAEQMNLQAVVFPGAAAYGLSDHTTGTTAAIMAVALGATVIEKHIRTGDVWTGPDAHFALAPEAFTRYVNAIREAEVMLGDGVKRPREGEWQWARWDSRTGKRGTRPSVS